MGHGGPSIRTIPNSYMNTICHLNDHGGTKIRTIPTTHSPHVCMHASVHSSLPLPFFSPSLPAYHPSTPPSIHYILCDNKNYEGEPAGGGRGAVGYQDIKVPRHAGPGMHSTHTHTHKAYLGTQIVRTQHIARASAGDSALLHYCKVGLL